ncbi:MAG TPA: tetratricopeptide repeat protein [Terriglobales bacterium]|nr:tetratricopeptide repeat protein [Terriglobales bacterium]
MASTGQIGQGKGAPRDGSLSPGGNVSEATGNVAGTPTGGVSSGGAQASPGRRLDSWKAIAQFLNRDIRSVQRWERDRGLPVHRLPGQKGGAVFAYEGELNEWLRSGREGGGPDSVAVLEGSTPQTPEQPATATAGPSGSLLRRFRGPWLIAAGLLIVGGLLVAWRSGWFSGSPRPIRSIAVLPLQNLSNDPNQEYFADGMTDELITDLAQLRDLKVVSKTSVLPYKGTHKSLPEIGRELGVDAVVEGSVLRAGDRVRITAQLIRASTDRHIWARAYEGDLRNVLSLQAGIAQSITDEVRLKLTPRERNRLTDTRSYDPEAYDLYLRGRYVFARRNEQALQEAMGYYQQAIAKDPGFSLAYAGLADCDALLALFGSGNSWLAGAATNARKALAMDDDLAEAHTSLAAVSVLNWNWDEAEKEFHRALDLNPNDAQTHQWYGNLLLGPKGRHAEAIAELRRALELDPLSPVIAVDLGYAYFAAGQYDSAYTQYQKVLATNPDFMPVHFQLAEYYRQRGMYADEIGELTENSRLAGRPLIVRDIQHLSQDREAFYRTIAETGGNFGHPEEYAGSYANSVEAYLMIGQKARALAALNNSYQKHEPYMIFIAENPLLSSLRGDPAFQELERKVGLRSP